MSPAPDPRDLPEQPHLREEWLCELFAPAREDRLARVNVAPGTFRGLLMLVFGAWGAWAMLGSDMNRAYALFNAVILGLAGLGGLVLMLYSTGYILDRKRGEALSWWGVLGVPLASRPLCRLEDVRAR